MARLGGGMASVFGETSLLLMDSCGTFPLLLLTLRASAGELVSPRIFFTTRGVTRVMPQSTKELEARCSVRPTGLPECVPMMTCIAYISPRKDKMNGNRLNTRSTACLVKRLRCQ
jgi:hypothetical protein